MTNLVFKNTGDFLDFASRIHSLEGEVNLGNLTPTLNFSFDSIGDVTFSLPQEASSNV